MGCAVLTKVFLSVSELENFLGPFDLTKKNCKLLQLAFFTFFTPHRTQ